MNLGCRKMLGNSRVVAQLAASQEQSSSVELVGSNKKKRSSKTYATFTLIHFIRPRDILSSKK
jgi:hypothetical protein